MLHTKRCTHATTRMALVRELHLSTGNTGSHDRDVEARVTSTVSWDTCVSRSLEASKSPKGPSPSTRYSGPWSHNVDLTRSSAWIPLLTRSAGFSAPWQCDDWSTQVNDCISHTRLATKVFHLVGVLRIHDREIMESVQQVIFTSFGNFRVSLTNTISLARRRLPSNSKRGSVTFFRGATLDFDITREDTEDPSPMCATK